MKTLNAVMRKDTPERYRWVKERRWVAIQTKHHGKVFRKTCDVFDEVRKLQRELGETEDPLSYSFEIAKTIPRESKQIKHRWADGFCTLLPETSDFSKLSKEHILNGETHFNIYAGNMTWNLCIESETAFYFIVRDFTTGGKLPINVI